MSAAVNIDHAIGAEVPSARKDWAGAWFDILEEMGEFIGMRAGRLAPGAAQPDWEFHSHAGQDGLGWFTGLIRRERPHAGIAIPRMKNTKRPSVLAQARALLQLVGRKPEAAARWNTFEAGWHPMPGAAVPGTAVAAHAFDVEGTRRLNDLAASCGVSLNSFLLATLGRVSAPRLNDGPAFWMMPVNMRGPVELERDTANHTSYLQIRTIAETTAPQVHEQVRARLSANEHWGGWLFANCGRIVRYAGMKWMFNRELARTGGRPWTGAFSNLGVWHDCGMWFVCPPVAKSCPLAVGAVICEGCLSLTIDAHPSIAPDAAWTRALLNNWITELGA